MSVKRIRSHEKAVGREFRNLGLVCHLLLTTQVALSKPPYLVVLVSYAILKENYSTVVIPFISFTLLSFRESKSYLWLCNASKQNVIVQCQTSHFALLGKHWRTCYAVHTSVSM